MLILSLLVQAGTGALGLLMNIGVQILMVPTLIYFLSFTGTI